MLSTPFQKFSIGFQNAACWRAQPEQSRDREGAEALKYARVFLK